MYAYYPIILTKHLYPAAVFKLCHLFRVQTPRVIRPSQPPLELRTVADAILEGSVAAAQGGRRIGLMQEVLQNQRSMGVSITHIYIYMYISLYNIHIYIYIICIYIYAWNDKEIIEIKWNYLELYDIWIYPPIDIHMNHP